MTRSPPPLLLALAAVLGLAGPGAAQGVAIDPVRVTLAGGPSERLRFVLSVTGTEDREGVVDLTPRALTQAPDGTLRDGPADDDLRRAVTLRPSTVVVARGRTARVIVEVVAPARAGSRALAIAAAPRRRASALAGAQVSFDVRFLVHVTVRAGQAGRPALALEDLRYDPDEGLVRAVVRSDDPFDRQARVEVDLLGRERAVRLGKAVLVPAGRAGQDTCRVWPGSRLELVGALAAPAAGGPCLLKATLEVAGRRQEVRLPIDLAPRAVAGAAPGAAGRLRAVQAALEVSAPAGAARLRALELRNDGPTPVKVRAFALEGEDPARSPVAWLEQAAAEVVVAPGRAARVGLVVRVPEHAAPGRYEAVLAVDAVDGLLEADIRVPLVIVVLGDLGDDGPRAGAAPAVAPAPGPPAPAVVAPGRPGRAGGGR